MVKENIAKAIYSLVVHVCREAAWQFSLAGKCHYYLGLSVNIKVHDYATTSFRCLISSLVAEPSDTDMSQPIMTLVRLKSLHAW